MKKHKQSGQALIELIIFLPLMFTLYSVISGFANAINGSINQQKIARAYFYFKIQNNSTFPKPDLPGEGRTWENWNSFGMFFIGWRQTLTNNSPVSTCYKMTIPLAPGKNDPPCEMPYTEPTTQWIRVGTVYGACGATYINLGTVYSEPDHSNGVFNTVYARESCLITR